MTDIDPKEVMRKLTKPNSCVVKVDPKLCNTLQYLSVDPKKFAASAVHEFEKRLGQSILAWATSCFIKDYSNRVWTKTFRVVVGNIKISVTTNCYAPIYYNRSHKHIVIVKVNPTSIPSKELEDFDYQQLMIDHAIFEERIEEDEDLRKHT